MGDTKTAAVQLFADVARSSKWHTRQQITIMRRHIFSAQLVWLYRRMETRARKDQLLFRHDDSIGKSTKSVFFFGRQADLCTFSPFVRLFLGIEFRLYLYPELNQKIFK